MDYRLNLSRFLIQPNHRYCNVFQLRAFFLNEIDEKECIKQMECRTGNARETMLKPLVDFFFLNY